jgi:hypothetical protein
LWEFGVFIYVRKLIRKTLREGITQGISVKPEWLSKFNYSFSKQEKIEFIEKYRTQVEKLLPKIISFFESKYGNVLKDIEVGERGFSMEELKHVIEDVDYNGKKISLTFKFKSLPYWERMSAMNEMGNDLHYYFNIDVGYYGIPLELHYE